jgi:hypothetical protein
MTEDFAARLAFIERLVDLGATKVAIGDLAVEFGNAKNVAVDIDALMGTEESADNPLTDEQVALWSSRAYPIEG